MDQAIIRRPSAGLSQSRNRDIGWLAALGVTLALILLVNPVGFVGGGWDDWQYLNAARCWVENGPCLPLDHWQGRWPVIAPIAGIMALLGESRLTIGLPSLAYAIGCLFLLARLGNRLAGPPVGYAAALVLLVMPVFGIELLGPNAEHPELFFLLLSASFIQAFAERKQAWLAFAAGLSWGLAFQVRETAITALPLLGVAAWMLARTHPRALIAAAVGAAVPFLAELLIYYVATGDPLWRRHLSIAHTQLPSTELAGSVDHSRPPFLNPDYIAGWKHQPGIHIHWAVDGLVNLFANVMAGLSIPFSLALAGLFRRRLTAGERRIVAWSIAAALYWAGFLIYVLAIDPKPRMMFVPVALTALALAVLLRRLALGGSTALASALFATCWLVGIANILLFPQLRTSEARAAEWAREFPAAIETDETTRRHLALVPESHEFAELGAGRPMIAVKLDSECATWATQHLPGTLQLLERSKFSGANFLAPNRGGNLCLFRYSRATGRGAVAAAISAR